MKREDVVELLKQYLGVQELTDYDMEAGCYLSCSGDGLDAKFLSLNMLVDFVQTYGYDIAYYCEEE